MFTNSISITVDCAKIYFPKLNLQKTIFVEFNNCIMLKIKVLNMIFLYYQTLYYQHQCKNYLPNKLSEIFWDFLAVPGEQSIHQSNTWNLFKVNNKETWTTSLTLILVLTLNRFHTLFYCFYIGFEQANVGFFTFS